MSGWCGVGGWEVVEQREWAAAAVHGADAGGVFGGGGAGAISDGCVAHPWLHLWRYCPPPLPPHHTLAGGLSIPVASSRAAVLVRESCRDLRVTPLPNTNPSHLSLTRRHTVPRTRTALRLTPLHTLSSPPSSSSLSLSPMRPSS
jgi:hypothetical protein